MSTRTACLPRARPRAGFRPSSSRTIFPLADKASFCQYDPLQSTLGRDRREEAVSLSWQGNQHVLHAALASRPVLTWVPCSTTDPPVGSWRGPCHSSKWPGSSLAKIHSRILSGITAWPHNCSWIRFSIFCPVQTFLLKLWPAQIHKYEKA